MGVFDLFTKDACSLGGRGSDLETWNWPEYEMKKKELGDKLVLVDMIGHPLPGSVAISDKLFSGTYPDGTVFALYCHSGGSSSYVQLQLTGQLPNYKFVNMRGGIMARGMYVFE